VAPPEKFKQVLKADVLQEAHAQKAAPMIVVEAPVLKVPTTVIVDPVQRVPQVKVARKPAVAPLVAQDLHANHALKCLLIQMPRRKSSLHAQAH